MKLTRGFCYQVVLLTGVLLLSSSVSAQDAPKQAVSVDLLVKGATIVTMDANRQVLENGFLAIRGDEIIAIGQDPAATFPKGLAAKQTIVRIVEPGRMRAR